MACLAQSYRGCVMRNLKTHQVPFSLDLCLNKTRAKKSLDHRDVIIVFEKFRYQDVIRSDTACVASVFVEQRKSEELGVFARPLALFLRGQNAENLVLRSLFAPRKRLLRRLVLTQNGKLAFFISTGLKTFFRKAPFS